MKNTEDIEPIENEIPKKKIDITALHALRPYLVEASELRGINDVNAGAKLSVLQEGLNICNQKTAIASMELMKAKVKRKELEAIARLEGFPEYAKEKGILKPSADLRDAYVDMDKNVQKALMEESYYEAIYEQLKNNKFAITMALSAVRSIAFGYKSSDSFSSGN